MKSTKRHREQTLFEQGLEGKTYPVEINSDNIQLHYEKKNGKLFLGDSIKWLSELPKESVDLIFADPPYNINKAD